MGLLPTTALGRPFAPIPGCDAGSRPSRHSSRRAASQNGRQPCTASAEPPRPPPSPLRLLQSFAAAAAAAAVVTAAPLALPPPSAAVTNEQLLFLEAWRAVDRAYVDKKFNGQNWFKVREDALKAGSMRSRVETYASIRSLLASLGDPFTRFLEPEQYSALR